MVIDSTNILDTKHLLSQTPPNYVEDNYYLNELQQKVIADWRFRPNRALIEIEDEFGSEKYSPLEVVLQSVSSEMINDPSTDWRRVVFKDILSKHVVGQRYRFAEDFDIKKNYKLKNVWIAVNQKPDITSSQIIRRCNGTIASIYTDEDGNNILHYEPVVQTVNSTNQGFQYDEIAIDTRGKLTIIAQYNKYTRQYYVNQRFVIGGQKSVLGMKAQGVDKILRVYKVTGILANDSNLTYDPENIGIMRIYLDEDQVSSHDDPETRLAYNGIKDVPILPDEKREERKNKDTEDVYEFKIVDPTSPPEILTDFRFKPALYLNGKEIATTITVEYNLTGIYAHLASLGEFVEITDVAGGYYRLRRIAEDVSMGIDVTCKTHYDDKDFEISFHMRLFG